MFTKGQKRKITASSTASAAIVSSSAAALLLLSAVIPAALSCCPFVSFFALGFGGRKVILTGPCNLMMLQLISGAPALEAAAMSVSEACANTFTPRATATAREQYSTPSKGSTALGCRVHVVSVRKRVMLTYAPPGVRPSFCIL